MWLLVDFLLKTRFDEHHSGSSSILLYPACDSTLEFVRHAFHCVGTHFSLFLVVIVRLGGLTALFTRASEREAA